MDTYKQYSLFNNENKNSFEKDHLNIDYVKDYFNEEILIVMNQGPENENVKLDPRYTYELNYSTHPQNQLNQNSVSLKPYTSLFLERK